MVLAIDVRIFNRVTYRHKQVFNTKGRLITCILALKNYACKSVVKRNNIT